MVAHVGCAVGIDDAQTFIVGGKLKPLARGDDHFGVYFQRSKATFGQVSINKLGDGTTPQPDQGDIRRARLEQQKCHHRTGVFQLQLIRRLDTHGALHCAAAQMQQPHTLFFADLHWTKIRL